MTSRVLFLTASIASGKTTALAAWAESNAGVAGILQPRSGSGRRLLDVSSGESVSLEAGPGQSAVLVGRFRFRSEAFAWANVRLVRAAATSNVVVLDEIGPLELRGEGLAEGLGAILDRGRGKSIVVVRESLLEDVRRQFGLEGAPSTLAEDWPQAGHMFIAAP